MCLHSERPFKVYLHLTKVNPKATTMSKEIHFTILSSVKDKRKTRKEKFSVRFLPVKYTLTLFAYHALQQGRGKGAAFKRQRPSVSSSDRRRGPKPKSNRRPGDNHSSKDDDSDDHRATTVITTVKDEFTLTQVTMCESR